MFVLLVSTTSLGFYLQRKFLVQFQLKSLNGVKSWTSYQSESESACVG